MPGLLKRMAARTITDTAQIAPAFPSAPPCNRVLSSSPSLGALYFRNPMPLTSGSKLGPYEIQSTLGPGGMGEFYAPRDPRLDRTVAIKILPEHLSEKPEAHARFEREARAVSSLNHPNICHIYDVGEQNGTRYLVMEYLQGETLADRLKK